LENVIQQAVLVSNGPELRLQNLPAPLQDYLARNPEKPAPAAKSPAPADTLLQNREARERTIIQRAIMTSEYSRARAADALGISRVTLYKKMRKYGLLNMPRRNH
jgi:DNA-binding NtrC family response regulator